MTGRIFPDVVIETERLRLRPFRTDDIDATLEACNDPETQRWLPLPKSYDRDVAETWCTRTAHAERTVGSGLVRAVTVDDAIVACVDLKHTNWAARTTEIGFWTHPASRRRGYMSEAVEALSYWVLDEEDFARVEIKAATDNLASRAVAERAGFTLEGTLRRAGYLHSGQTDLVVYSLIPDDVGL